MVPLYTEQEGPSGWKAIHWKPLKDIPFYTAETLGSVELMQLLQPGGLGREGGEIQA